MSTDTCSLEGTAFMSSEWETDSDETMTHMLFKGSPVRKKINLVDYFSSIPFRVFFFPFSLCPAYYHMWVPADQAHGHVYVSMMNPLNERASGQSKNLFRDRQCSLSSWFTCGLRLLPSPVPEYSFTSMIQGHGFKMLLLGEGSGTAKRNYLNKNCLSTTSEGSVGFHIY